MEPKIWVFGRVWQSFEILKNNFLSLTLPLFIYNFIALVLVWAIFFSVLFSNMWNISDSKFDWFILLDNPIVIINITIWVLLFIAYLILYIPVLLSLLKSVKQAIAWENITIKENLNYWFSRIINSFKTYWYIFSYVALIPAIIFIIWWLLIIIGFSSDWLSILGNIWAILIAVWWITFVVFAIYRWIKATFALYSAVDEDSFTKSNFLNSIELTDNKWWIIVWNFIVISLIMWVISFIIWFVFWVIYYSWVDFQSINTLEEFISFANNFSIIPQIISGFLNNIINTIITVFSTIFIYLLFLRFKQLPETEIIDNNHNKIEKIG